MKNLENVYHGLRYVGYPCMNRTLRERSPPIRANRGLQMKTLEQKGLSYVSSLIEQNLKDLRTILQWNVDNNIFFYRCTSNLFPKNSQYEIDNIPNYSSINSLCQEIGDFIKENNVRLSFHPDHWVKLASPTQSVVENSLETIENHAEWYSLFGLESSPLHPINIHIGAHYSDKNATRDRLVSHYNNLSQNAQNHLVLENDDTTSLWSVSELKEIGRDHNIPIKFDYLHHYFTDRGLTYQDAFNQCKTTWPTDIPPVTHYSEPRRLYSLDTETQPKAHSEYVQDIPEWLIQQSSVMIEANSKEKAVFQFRSTRINSSI